MNKQNKIIEGLPVIGILVAFTITILTVFYSEPVNTITTSFLTVILCLGLLDLRDERREKKEVGTRSFGKRVLFPLNADDDKLIMKLVLTIPIPIALIIIVATTDLQLYPHGISLPVSIFTTLTVSPVIAHIIAKSSVKIGFIGGEIDGGSGFR